MPFAFQPLASVPPLAVDALLDQAFGVDRHRRTAYRLREGTRFIPDLSLAILGPADALLAMVQAWPVALTTADGAAVPLILVGPVAVEADRRSLGFGRALMEQLLATAASRLPMVLIGDPGYYERFFGFSAEATAGWQVPGPVERHRLLARANGFALPKAGMLEGRR